MKLHCVLLVALFGIAYSKTLKYKDNPQKNKPYHLDSEHQWQEFKKVHNKTYTTKEEPLRKNVWRKNLKIIYQHNREYKAGLKMFRLGINEYADLTFSEYQRYLLGARPPKDHLLTRTNVFKLKSGKSVPDSVDWRDGGVVTPIKNQGRCGSCWAFSSTGALEGMHYRRKGYLVSMSEQNLVDCTLKFGNAGCNGGWMNNAFRYVQENGGIDYEQAYPYQAKTGTSCHYSPDYSGTTAAAHVDIGYGLEEDLQGATATMGPIAVAIDATHKSFQLYESGVYFEPKCKNDTSDHAVLVIGYGTEDGNDYWLVKNSWGTSWGEKGFIKMTRNKNNNCAIASFASVPLEYY